MTATPKETKYISNTIISMNQSIHIVYARQKRIAAKLEEILPLCERLKKA